MVAVGQNSSSSKIEYEKIIPTVKYDSVNFVANIRAAFNNYTLGVRYAVKKEGRKRKIISNCGGTYGYACIDKSLVDIIIGSPDSVFFVHFHDNDEDKRTVMGILKDEAVKIIDFRGVYYSSIEEYLELVLKSEVRPQSQQRSVRKDDSATLLQMKTFILGSYQFYEVRNPTDTSDIIRVFINELANIVKVTPGQKKSLKQSLYKLISSETNDEAMPPCCVITRGTDRVWLMKKNVAGVLYQTYTPEQYLNIERVLWDRKLKLDYYTWKIYTEKIADKENIQYLLPEEIMSLMKRKE
jgi:hypothetical protein